MTETEKPNEVVYMAMRLTYDLALCPCCNATLRFEPDLRLVEDVRSYYENKIAKILEFYK